MAEFDVLGKILLGAILFLFGAVMIGVIADTVKPLVSTIEVANESHAMTNSNATTISSDGYTVSVTDWNKDGCPLTSFSLKNQSGTALTITDDYTVTLALGNYTLKNTTATTKLIGAYNKTYASYNYCKNGYMDSSWGRSVMSMIAGFIALLLMGAAVGIFYSVFKEVSEK